MLELDKWFVIHGVYVKAKCIAEYFEKLEFAEIVATDIDLIKIFWDIERYMTS